MTRAPHVPPSPLAPPPRVVVATSDRVYAASLEVFLTAAAMRVRCQALPERGPVADLPAGWADVLLVEIHALGSAEWRLLEEVRRRDPLVEVVAISADPVVEDAVSALRAGVYAVLQYPVSSEQLADTVAHAAARKRRAEGRLRELEDDRCPPGGGKRGHPEGALPPEGGGAALVEGPPTLRVLLVDDEEPFLLAAGRVLRRRGMQVLTARDGRECLSTLDRGPVDVVVLDVRMPGMDGDEVAHHIERRHPGLPVILLTGHGGWLSTHRVPEGGTFEVLAKPCDVEHLAGRIRAAAAARAGDPLTRGAVVPAGERVAVLLVDDEVELLASLGRVLGRRGMAVATASSGEEALDDLTRRDADVVVLDLKMPGLDGLETLRRIKAGRPDRQVILLTGHPKLETAAAGLDLGAVECLSKPPDVERLSELILTAWAARRRVLDAARASEPVLERGRG